MTEGDHMTILSCNNISKSFGITPILDHISFCVEKGDRLGIIGVNGSGKSTLLQIIKGSLESDTGEIHIAKHIRMGFLEQEVVAAPSQTLYGYCEEIFSPLLIIEKKLRQLEQQMATQYDQKIQKEYTHLQETFERQNGYGIQSQIKGVLSGLGFSDVKKPLSVLSGGERAKAGIARLLLTQPELLILDEPTNHLDLQSIEWLEQFIKEYPGTVLLVSHDRYFLDSVCNTILEIEATQSYEYDGNYSTALQTKRDEYQQSLKQYEFQQKEIKRQEAIICTLMNRSTKKMIKRAKSRQKLLDRIPVLPKPTLFHQLFSLQLKSKRRLGHDILLVQGLKKSYDRLLFQNVDFQVYQGDRIGIIGDNGIGKSTLFRILLGEETPDGGDVQRQEHVDIGYHAQNQYALASSHSILQELHDAYPQLTLTQARDYLGQFQFKGDDVDKKVHQLSGGEKSRLSLLKLMLGKSNFLLLDEPTNHLDIASRDSLEQALNAYDSSFLVISHDRYFLNAVCNKIIHLTPDGATLYHGNYDYYKEKTISNEPTLSTPPTTSKQKEQREKDKQMEREQRRNKRRADALETQLSEQEQELLRLQEESTQPHIYQNADASLTIMREIEEKKEQIQQIYDELEGLLQYF